MNIEEYRRRGKSLTPIFVCVNLYNKLNVKAKSTMTNQPKKTYKRIEANKTLNSIPVVPLNAFKLGTAK